MSYIYKKIVSKRVFLLVKKFLSICLAVVCLSSLTVQSRGFSNSSDLSNKNPIATQRHFFSGFLVDQNSPTVKFNGLRHYARVSNQLSVMVEANDDVGVTRIELYANGILIGANNITPAAVNAQTFFLWNTTTRPNGKYFLQAKAFDAAGNSQTTIVVVLSHNYFITPPTGNTIALNPYVKFQTMNGWEATSQAGQFSSVWNNYKNRLFDQAVNDLGINRIRLEIRSGIENPTDYFTQWRNGQITDTQFNAKRYEIINDDSNPNTINSTGFKWAELDFTVENIILPMRQRLQASGERLWVNVNYIDFGSSAFEHKNSPNEYAEFVLATYQHLQSTYGFVPDSWEVVLEPDTSTAAWSSAQIANAIKAAGDRLSAHGFTPQFVAPSTTNAANAPIYIDQIAQTTGAMRYVSEFSYHRYCCANTTVLQDIYNRSLLFNKRAGMLEWIGADHIALHEDLKLGRNSSWQQFTLAFPDEPDNGAQYYLIDTSNTTNPIITMGSRTKFLRQYFKFIRFGAQRIEALTGNPNFDPVAFINTNGKYVVVVKSSTNGAFNIQGLPAGIYGIKYTTANQYNIDLPDVLLGAGQPLNTNIPAVGIITIYGK